MSDCDNLRAGEASALNSPDKNDAICLLSMFDLSKPGQQITNADIETKIGLVGKNSPERWTLTRIHAHMHQFGHIAGTYQDEFGQRNTYAVDKDDLDAIVNRQ